MTRQNQILRTVFIVGLGLHALGCGGSAFEPKFQKAEPSGYPDPMKAVQAPSKRTPQPVIVGVGGSKQGLFAWDLEGGKMLWSRGTKAKSIPIVAGDLVIIQEKDGVFARHLKSGEVALDLGDDGSLVGADGDGIHTVISMKMSEKSNPRGVLVGAMGGEIKWKNELKLPVGVPSVKNGVVVVPWASHRISLLNANTGDEQARYELNETLVGRTFVHGADVFAGHHGLFRVNDEVESKSPEAPGYYEPFVRKLPNQPPFISDGYQPLHSPDDTSLESRLLWKPKSSASSDGQTTGLLGDTIYLVHHSTIYALRSDSDELKWIHQSASQVVGTDLQGSAITLVTQKGQITQLNVLTGREVFSADMGVSGIRAAFVRAGDFGKGLSNDKKPAPLKNQIYAIIENALENNVSDDSGFIVRYLAQFDEAKVTEKLVDLCSDLKNPPSWRGSACKTLEGRKNGSGAVREALRRRASFLKNTLPPPSGSLAGAAANMDIRESIPDMLHHLWDPATPVSELAGIIEGLGKMGGKNGIDALDKFLKWYHAGARDEQLIKALEKAAEAIVSNKKDDAKDTLDYIATDPRTPPPLTSKIKELINSLNAPKKTNREKVKPDEKTGNKGNRS